MIRIIINKNKIELLKIIQGFRYVPFKGLLYIAKSQRLYVHLSSLSRAVKKLKTDGLVRSFLYGNNQAVVYITKKGARVLADETNLQIKDISIPNQGQKVQFATLEHTVKIIEIYVELAKACTANENLSIGNWIGDQNILCKYEFRNNRKGNKIRRVLAPDSYFEVIKGKKIIPFFLEYDTGTMDKNQLAPKFMRYFEYFAYGNWEEKYEKFPNILFLTERSEKSLENLLVAPEISLDSALNNRKHFTESKNLLWKGIGLSENVRNISASKIKDFLNHKFLFKHLNTQWTKNILEELE